MHKSPEVLKFPKNFLFGTATAGHQVEGDNIHSDWWDYEQTGKLPFKSGKACDSWNRWQEDIDLTQSLHNNAYRFSIEWARIEPQEGVFNAEALKHYADQIKYLHKLGMKAAVTLWHFVLPKWFADKGGFAKRGNVAFFDRYVQYLVDNLQDPPDLWLTMNEVGPYIVASYIAGLWPPKKKNIFTAIVAFFNIAHAHNQAQRIIHKHHPEAQVGYAHHMIYFSAVGKALHIKFLAYLSDAIFNRGFLWLTQKCIDFIGINYYVLCLITHKNLIPKYSWKSLSTETSDRDSNDLGWFTHPEGLYALLLSLKKHNKPVYITENGVADAADKKRQKYLSNHFEWLLEAVKDGVDIRGYFYWSLIDNYEWVFGYAAKFGLFKCEENTFERVIQPSAAFYSNIAARGELDLL